MAEINYEVPKELLLELMAVCDLATEAWDDRKETACTNEGALEASQCGWRAAEGWRWLCAIKDGKEFTPEPFESAHCAKCGDRTDTGEPHECEEEEGVIRDGRDLL